MLLQIPVWMQAGLWGLVSGSALLLGALVGYFLTVPQRLIAGVMAFGSGVLFSALSFELMDIGGFVATAGGFLGGALLYSGANYGLSRRGAKHRKRSGEEHPKEGDQPGSGMAIAAGALLDGIPEAIVIGLSLLSGRGGSMVAVMAVFLSNIPEGLSSAAGKKKAGRSRGYVLGVWLGIALISGVAALVGYQVFQEYSNAVIAATTALAAGAILAMLVDTMIPEAFSETREFAGLLTVLGFLTAFVLSKWEGQSTGYNN